MTWLEVDALVNLDASRHQDKLEINPKKKKRANEKRRQIDQDGRSRFAWTRVCSHATTHFFCVCAFKTLICFWHCWTDWFEQPKSGPSIPAADKASRWLISFFPAKNLLNGGQFFWPMFMLFVIDVVGTECTAFSRCLGAGSKVFWVRANPAERWVTNSRWKMAPLAATFHEFPIGRCV